MNPDEIDLVLSEHKQNLQMEKINGMDATDNTRYFENFQMEKKTWDSVMRMRNFKLMFLPVSVRRGILGYWYSLTNVKESEVNMTL